MSAARKKKVLFICTHNSARSQMAEGFINSLYGKMYEAYSAGTKPGKVNPYAIKVMEEIGIDISNHKSKSVSLFKDTEFDYVVTVCDHAKERCPFFPDAKKYLHKGFFDPSSITGSGEKKLFIFREVRDEIFNWIRDIFGGNNDK